MTSNGKVNVDVRNPDKHPHAKLAAGGTCTRPGVLVLAEAPDAIRDSCVLFVLLLLLVLLLVAADPSNALPAIVLLVPLAGPQATLLSACAVTASLLNPLLACASGLLCWRLRAAAGLLLDFWATAAEYIDLAVSYKLKLRANDGTTWMSVAPKPLYNPLAPSSLVIRMMVGIIP